MSRIFITGAADGLGQMAARILIAEGHKVVAHARNEKRAQQALLSLPGAQDALVGDLSSIEETVTLARKVNDLGVFDAIIHNAGIGYREPTRNNTKDGLPEIFAVNSLAPYLLTALIDRPSRLIYLSSGLHRHGDPTLADITWKKRPWNGFQAYADSKLHDLIICKAIARLWPDVFANAVEPGWVATKMGGAAATDSLEDGPKTQCWLAVSNDKEVKVSGQYFYHQRAGNALPAASEQPIQDAFLEECRKITGVVMPK